MPRKLQYAGLQVVAENDLAAFKHEDPVTKG
jgi:hypothetical protein